MFNPSNDLGDLFLEVGRGGLKRWCYLLSIKLNFLLFDVCMIWQLGFSFF
jgi:hypothetical protein